MENERKKITILDLQEMKRKKEKITFLTGYDYPMASLEDKAGVEMILVGDSLGMTVYGHQGTLPVTMEQMLFHTDAVCRAAKYAFVIGDMPYMSYQISHEEAIRNAGRFMVKGADAIKLEGGARVASTVEAIVNAGIPVMGHIGMTPQSASMIGGYKAQGKKASAAKALINDAKSLEDAGAFAILLECIPDKIGKIITETLSIPVLSIGAGPDCDGQLIIVNDLIGLFEFFKPKFVKRYANISPILLEAFQNYCKEVKEGVFPTKEHCYSITDEEYEKLRADLGI